MSKEEKSSENMFKLLLKRFMKEYPGSAANACTLSVKLMCLEGPAINYQEQRSNL